MTDVYIDLKSNIILKLLQFSAQVSVRMHGLIPIPWNFINAVKNSFKTICYLWEMFKA